MKKIYYVYISIVLVLTIGGLILEQTNEYSKERLLWRIQNDYKKIDQPHHVENEFIVKKIISRYEQFIKRYPTSVYIPKAKLGLADTLIELNRLVEGREIYSEIITKYKINEDIVAQTQYSLAKSYEQENNWPKAITIYRSIVREYPLTPTGFSIPYYLGNFYINKGLKSTAISAFHEAIEFYENISVNYPDSPLGYSSLQMLIKSHFALGQWMDAYYSAKNLLFQYPLAASTMETIQTLNMLSLKKLRNSKLLISTYNEFLKKNPGHPIKPKLEAIIKKLIVESKN